MAKLIIPTPDQWAVLETLGLTENRGGATVLVHPELANAAQEDGLDLVAASPAYHCGSDPDLYLDIVDDTDHLFLSRAREPG